MYHKPVLIKESINGLNINPKGIYVDATFGSGGHSNEIIKKLDKKGLLIAIDQDKDAHLRLDEKSPQLNLIYGNFRFLKNYLRYLKIDYVDGILADFGVSSHQFDQKERGFSYRLGGNLDMRMNTNSKLTAEHIINNYSEEELNKIFFEYSDIKNAKKLTKTIIEAREYSEINDIEQFLEIIKPLSQKHKEFKFYAQVFQALRIEVNDEINALYDFLESCKDCLKTGGRLSAISYHSVEDRAVKNLIKTGSPKGDVVEDIYGKTTDYFKPINKKIIIPEEEEVQTNSRAKSAKLRIAERV